MMNKLKVIITMVLAVMLVLFLSGGALAVFAEETVTEQQETTSEDEVGETAETIEDVATNFVEWLESTFGEDYEYYYNSIIDTWGSIEEYLLQFGEEALPEQFQTGWQNFVQWLGDYAPIWAPALAVIILIVAYVIGKKRFEKIIKKVVDSKITAVSEELNKQSNAQVAQGRALKALLGNGEKFAENVKELEESEKELNS